MRFRFDPEHDELRAALRRLLAEQAGAAAAPGWDVALVKRLAGELGVFALAIPERYGGAGFGLLELGVVFEEAGRALLRAPLLSAALASGLLLASADEAACAAYLPGVATGQLVATAAVHEPGGAGWAEPSAASAENAAGRWLVSGVKEFVPDAGQAGLFVVSAAAPEGTSLFTVDAAAAGLAVEAVETVDLSRDIGRLRLDRTPATLVGAAGDGARALAHTRDVGLALLAAEQVGIAGFCLDLATGWAKQRVQFGRTIGSFQAVKHKLATVRLELEAAVAASMYALYSADHRPAELPGAARIAAYTCGEAALLAAQENIQVHGGMGATWEHPAHRYLRRASFDRLFLGDPQAHLEALAGQVERSLSPIAPEV